MTGTLRLLRLVLRRDVGGRLEERAPARLAGLETQARKRQRRFGQDRGRQFMVMELLDGLPDDCLLEEIERELYIRHAMDEEVKDVPELADTARG